MNNRCKQLTNQKLIQQLKSLTGDERKVQAEFLAHLAEVDSRRLYAK
jgi:hypothetical protein